MYNHHTLPMNNKRARILWTLFALVSISFGTFVAIRVAQGYRFSRTEIVTETGLLVANSVPTGARILINGELRAATDDTISLDPGEYDIEISKDGYSPWRKRLRLEKQLVTQANALLFPTAPSLSPLTFAGAQKLTPSPDGQRLVMYTASASAAANNGYFVLELTDSPLAFQRGPRQILPQSDLFPVDDTWAVWSPDSSQVLFVSPQKSILIDPSRSNNPDTMPDITAQLPTIFSQWEEEMYRRDRQRLALFPTEIQKIATESAVNAYFSPDGEKLLYTATAAFTLPDSLIPEKVASNTQPQARTTEIGKMYIYDREEDRQFVVGEDTQFIESLSMANPEPEPVPVATRSARRPATPAPVLEAEEATASGTYNPQKRLLADDLFNRQAMSLDASPSAFMRLQDAESVNKTIENFRTYHSPLFSHGVQWFPNSNHVISTDSAGITVTEYDGSNRVLVYAGPFVDRFVYPWPNGSRLIILTNFQIDGPPNLYTVDLN